MWCISHPTISRLSILLKFVIMQDGKAMAKTAKEAKARGQEYYKAWDAGYWVGHREGHKCAVADLNIVFESCDNYGSMSALG
jgi:hypothetical protein